MLNKYFTQILYVTGAVTMVPVLQFFAPGVMLAQSHLQVGDPAGMFHTQHWGLLAFCFGALLIYAARNPPMRKPVVLAAAVEKLGLCALVLMAWSEPALQGLHVAVAFDGLCVVLYTLWLLTAPKA